MGNISRNKGDLTQASRKTPFRCGPTDLFVSFSAVFCYKTVDMRESIPLHTRPLVTRVRDFIEEHGLIERGDGVVVAVSGGPDSVFLLHALSLLREDPGMTLHAAHVNYRLRGRDAEKDMELVEAICAENRIPLSVRILDDDEVRWIRGGSTQEKARKLRYDFFAEVMERAGGNRVATGHTRDDQAETVLLNVLRGSGLGGLGGIRPLRGAVYCRPLLAVGRKEIEEYLRNLDITFRTDRTNRENTYRRNRVRNRLIPLLREEYNPNIVERLCEMAGQARESSDFIRFMGEPLLNQAVVRRGEDKIVLDLQCLLKYNKYFLKILLRLLIHDFQGSTVDITSHHIDHLVAFLTEKEPGGVFQLPHGLTIRCSVGSLLLETDPEKSSRRKGIPDTAIEIPGRTPVPGSGLTVLAGLVTPREQGETGPSSAEFDYECIEKPLMVRNWREGDRIEKPLGGRSKKLSDLFLEARIPTWQRWEIPLIADTGGILWVVGYAISKKYLPGARTTRILRLRILDTESCENA